MVAGGGVPLGSLWCALSSGVVSAASSATGLAPLSSSSCAVEHGRGLGLRRLLPV